MLQTEPTEFSQDILPEIKDPNVLTSTTTSEPALEESSTEIILDFLPEKPEIKDPGLLTSTTTSEPTESSQDILPEILNPNVLVSTTTSEPALEASSTEIVLDFLPEKPVSVTTESVHTIGESIQYVGDPPFDTLGLNSLWPPGRAQWLMEHIHNDLDLPWYTTILISEYLLNSTYLHT